MRAIAERFVFGETGGQRAAVAVMLLAALGYSLLAPVAAFFDGGASPLLFNAALRGGAALGLTLIGGWVWRRTVFSRRWWIALGPAWKDWRVLAAVVLGGWDSAFWIAAAGLADVGVAKVVHGTGPLALMAALALSARLSGGHYRSIFWPGLAAAGLVMLVGVFVTASSQEGRLLLNFGDWSVALAGAVFLAFAAVGFGACNGLPLGWALVQQRRLAIELGPERAGGPLLYMAVALWATNVLSGPVMAVIGLAAGEELARPAAGAVFLYGLFVFSLSGLGWGWSNLAGRNLAVNCFAYGEPLFVVAWLSLLGLLTVAAPVWLMAGAALVIGGNCLALLAGRRQRG